jgi:sec-independent protein translocase protein TatA
MEALSPGHLVVLVAIAGMLFFGWKQLPDMAKSAGRSLRIFRTEIGGVHSSVKEATEMAREAGASVKLDPNASPVATPVPTEL